MQISDLNDVCCLRKVALTCWVLMDWLFASNGKDELNGNTSGEGMWDNWRRGLLGNLGGGNGLRASSASCWCWSVFLIDACIYIFPSLCPSTCHTLSSLCVHQEAVNACNNREVDRTDCMGTETGAPGSTEDLSCRLEPVCP